MRAGARGFTMLELIMAMAVFTILGAAAVLLMRQGLSIFASASRDAALQDRLEGVLPQVAADLNLVALPASFDPPPPPPTEEERLEGEEYVPPPPVAERLRATPIVLRDLPESLKGLPAWYVGWTVDVTGERSDPILRRAGERAVPSMRPVVPAEEESDKLEDTYFLPTGGLREIVYIAVPGNPETYDDPSVVQHPALLTLYYGWRSPVGGPNSLLDVENVDSVAEIVQACRPVAEGLIHFGVTWRRVFSHDWQPTIGRVGETDGYVGPLWDSTRALDKEFPLFKSPESLGDPSDDVFPAWARLEITLVAPSTFGFGRGETRLAEPLGADERFLRVEDVEPLLGPGPETRYLKVGGEWMRYLTSKVKPRTGQVPVERGRRGTKAVSHDVGADVYVGLSSSRDVRLLFRDRYARRTRKPR